MGGDRAGKTYWDATWGRGSLQAPIRPEEPGISNYVKRQFHRLFLKCFEGTDTRGQRLIEVGCARSAWLPYFAREFGFDVAGIDYSERGCSETLRVLDRESVPGTVICADMFAPPEILRRSADVVVSFGLVEHFERTDEAVSALAELAKPGGMILTLIPNMAGWTGKLQKLMDKETFLKHVEVDRERLLRAHVSAGLEVLSCDYLLYVNIGVANMNSLKRPSIEYSLKSLALKVLGRAGTLAWIADPHGTWLQPNRLTSPYLICIARRMDDREQVV